MPTRRPQSRLWLQASFCLATALLASGGTVDTERVETFARDGVTLKLRASPPAVSLATDVEVTLELTYPEALDVVLPSDFADRFEGFRLEGSYEGESLTAGGVRQRTLHLRARPIPAAEQYRIAPFAVRVRTPGAGGGRETWFPTRPVVFSTQSLLKPGESAPEGVVTSLSPIWVRPSAATVARWCGGVLLALLGLVAIAWAIRRLRRRVVLARMSPRERALLELRELLARDWPTKGRTKEFYVELTRVVRRYIERRYGVRAPEQTTEEFLQEAARLPVFAAATLARLREFLDAADLVKFAGVDASPETVARSVATARAYLESESTEDRARSQEVPR